jgi:hypothetical protein
MRLKLAAAFTVAIVMFLAARVPAGDAGTAVTGGGERTGASGTGTASETAQSGTTGTGKPAEPGTAEGTSDSENAASTVPNYDFEKGKDGQPDSWGGSSGIDDFPFDMLTQFWVERPDGEGMCVKLDTDVYKKEWEVRYDELKADPKSKPFSKTPTVGKKYDTMGGLDGVRIVSKRIPIQKGKQYRLTAEVRSELGTKVIIFVKGYTEVGGRERLVYDAPKHCEPEKQDLGKWKTYTRTFNPGESKGTTPDYIKIHVYAYWPAGTVYIDNILVTEEKEIKSPDAEKTEGKDAPSGGEKKPPEGPEDEGKKDGEN